VSQILPKLPEGWYRGNLRHRLIMQAHGVDQLSSRKLLWDHLKRCTWERLFWYFIGASAVVSFFQAHPERFWPIAGICAIGLVAWWIVVSACYATNYNWMRNEQIIAEQKRRKMKVELNPLSRINVDRVARLWGLVCFTGVVASLIHWGWLSSPYK
jgi:hypothetical protein